MGSGKTATRVYEMQENIFKTFQYSNIETSIKNHTTLKPFMIIKKELAKTKIKKDGDIVESYKYSPNLDFWQKAKKPISITLDEAHNLVDSRDSQSPKNKAITKWQTAIRRILGQTEAGYGELCYITQIPDALDIRIRLLASCIQYHILHYVRMCKKCFLEWGENSDLPQSMRICPRCKEIDTIRKNFVVEIYKFENIDKFYIWLNRGEKTYYDNYFIMDIERIFPLYKSLQWENLFEDY